MGIENGVDEIEALLASGKLDENASVADIAALLEADAPAEQPTETGKSAADEAGDKSEDDGKGEAKGNEAAGETKATDKGAATEHNAEQTARDQQTTDVQGPIAGPNGSTIPYAVLAGTRRDLSDARRRLEEMEQQRAQEKQDRERVERERDDLRAKLQATADSTRDVQAAADAAGMKGDVLTIDTSKLREEFPAQIVDAIEALQRGYQAQQQTIANLRQDEKKSREEREVEHLQHDIDSVPVLADWQANNKALWNAAKAVDETLLADTAWKDRPRVERFQEVARQLGGATPSSSSATKPDAAAAGKKTTVDDALARADRAAVPVSHSGLPAGAAPAQSEADGLANLDVTQIADKFGGMSDDQLEKLLARFG